MGRPHARGRCVMDSSRPERVPIVGGPNDGKVVSYIGDVMFEPVTRPLRPQDYLDLLPPKVGGEIEKRVYRLRQWSDRRIANGWRYVLDEMREGLGAP